MGGLSIDSRVGGIQFKRGVENSFGDFFVQPQNLPPVFRGLSGGQLLKLRDCGKDTKQLLGMFQVRRGPRALRGCGQRSGHDDKHRSGGKAKVMCADHTRHSSTDGVFAGLIKRARFLSS